MLLEGKVAIVTGAGSGIGRAEALSLASQGAKVLVNDLPGGNGREDTAAQTVAMIAETGGEAVANHTSVASFAGGKAIVEAAMDAFGQLDVLVNNAGFARPASIADMTEEEWDDVIAVHLTGTFATCRHAGAIMRAQRHGSIINTASESGLGHLGMCNYSAAKEAIVALTKTAARDLSRYGVRVNAIRPRALTGISSPRLFDTLKMSQDVLGIATHGDRWVSLDEMNPPNSVGEFVAWLASDASAPANGETFFVGGGVVALYGNPELARTMYKEGGWSATDLTDKANRGYLLEGLTDRYKGPADWEDKAVGLDV